MKNLLYSFLFSLFLLSSSNSLFAFLFATPMRGGRSADKRPGCSGTR